MITRSDAVREVERLLRRFPVVAVVGARQVGKSTLARQIAQRAPAGVLLGVLRFVGEDCCSA